MTKTHLGNTLLDLTPSVLASTRGELETKSVPVRLPLRYASWHAANYLKLSGWELSPRNAFEAPMQLSNNAELKAKFITRIDGEFWIQIRYIRDFHFSREHPAALTEFSASYIIRQEGNTIQKGGFRPGAELPALVSGPYYGPCIGKFPARRGVEYEITIRLGADVPNGLPKSAMVDISLDPRVPYSWLRGW